MGDRCYLSVTCRKQDKKRFEELGFYQEFEAPDRPIIEMVEEEANYAHAGQMPTDIPYTAWHGAGSNYGDDKLACDGKEFAEVAANNDGFVLAWDYEIQQPTPQSVERIRHYLALHQRVEAMFKSLNQPA